MTSLPTALIGEPQDRYIPALAGGHVRVVCSDVRLLDQSGRDRCGDEGPGQPGPSFSLS